VSPDPSKTAPTPRSRAIDPSTDACRPPSRRATRALDRRRSTPSSSSLSSHLSRPSRLDIEPASNASCTLRTTPRGPFASIRPYLEGCPDGTTRPTRVDGLDLDGRDATRLDEETERETIERAIGHPSSPRAVVVGDEGAISIRARSRDRSRGRSRVSRGARARVWIVCARTTYLGDDGGASGDALLRARGSRRERDQSGVQRQGDHDCVCVTPVVQPSRACVRAFGRGRGERHRYMGQDSSKSPPPPSRRNPIHFDANPSTRRGLLCVDR